MHTRCVLGLPEHYPTRNRLGVMVLALDLDPMSDFSLLAIPNPDSVESGIIMLMMFTHAQCCVAVVCLIIEAIKTETIIFGQMLVWGPIDNINCISETSQPLNYSQIFSH